MEMIHYHFDTLLSTNDWAKEHLTIFNPDGLSVVSADQQTAGRGQFGRTWISPAHLNLYTTFVFSLSAEIEPFVFTHLLATTVAEAFPQLTYHLKWPNDLQVKQKKIAGILCEALFKSDGYQTIILGLGLNINMEPDHLAQVKQPATSLFIETGLKYDLPILRSQLITHFQTNLSLFKQKGFSPFQTAFNTLTQCSNFSLEKL